MNKKQEVTFKSKEIEFHIDTAKFLVSMVIENIDVNDKSNDDLNKKIEDAIESGLNYIKETEWHKELSPESKIKSLKTIQADFRNAIDEKLNLISEKENYVQKCFDLLADKEFRELLNLVYISSDGNFKSFSKELIENLGTKSENFMDLYFFIAEKDYDCFDI